MRVIAGNYKGRKIHCPEGQAVRPTSDMVRSAIFNILNNYVEWENMRVLDIFCGTGALGLEALSRGASFCRFVDIAAESIKYTQKNLEKIPPENYEILQMDANRISVVSAKFNLVFIDPPYRTNLAQETLDNIAKSELLAEDGIVVVEASERQDLNIPTPLELISERHYGNTKVFIIKL